MLEASRLARRTAALARSGEGAVRVLPACSRFSLRVKGVAVPTPDPPRPWEGSAVELANALALPINRSTMTGDRTLARLGPDEWLVVGPEADTDAIAAEIAAGPIGRVHALVDVSHRQVGIEVAGPDAADILNAGCPLDLHPSACPVGFATRTILGKAEIVLIRTGEATFRVECWRSFAAYAHAFLEEAARGV